MYLKHQLSQSLPLRQGLQRSNTFKLSSRLHSHVGITLHKIAIVLLWYFLFHLQGKEEVIKEAEELNKQMDAFVALRIKVENHWWGLEQQEVVVLAQQRGGLIIRTMAEGLKGYS
ncbi:uncharacterized protein LOC104880357 isoform X2 [Vitis vinifera]|uniref:uncharacterized protein LOC104880357 isoform X2 n=1 Tax=Vitis vinifera TaxID=29760 RepID=UPI0028831039|nr:uncharacterized protein LOC104880357 isoform X2 [Vitis vinifera]